MKFLHTSDWHLGKVFHEKSLIDDQKYVLDQIIDVMKAASDAGEPYAALVVSGDIYDRAVPPTEAVTLLDDFLIRLTRSVPGTHIFLNAGNHDGAGRLSFAARFLEENNIHLVTDTKHFTEPVMVEQGDEKCAFYQLPFLTPLSIQTEDTLLRTQQDLYAEAMARLKAAHTASYAGVPAVLNAHLFAQGAVPGASERSNVGDVERVGTDLFSWLSYGAFGHIHKCLPLDADRKLWYSGALLAYNFDDDPVTGMNEVTIDCSASGAGKSHAVSVRRIPFKALHPVAKVRAEMKTLTGSLSDRALIEANSGCYVQVILTDEVMPLEAFANLRTVFPNLLSVTMEVQAGAGRSSSIEERKKVIDSRDPAKIIDQFMQDLYGDTDDELIRLQKELFVREAR